MPTCNHTAFFFCEKVIEDIPVNVSLFDVPPKKEIRLARANAAAMTDAGGDSASVTLSQALVADHPQLVARELLAQPGWRECVVRALALITHGAWLDEEAVGQAVLAVLPAELRKARKRVARGDVAAGLAHLLQHGGVSTLGGDGVVALVTAMGHRGPRAFVGCGGLAVLQAVYADSSPWATQLSALDRCGLLFCCC
jgi:hypothetical protein